MDDGDTVNAESPVIRRGYAGLISIWLVPLIAVVIAGWIVFTTLSEKGPEISISLNSAQGMEAGKTPLKYKDVVIGVVDRIEIPDDEDGIRVIVAVQQAAEKYMTDTARFWVVSPAVSLDGVSGLETLLSGSYLEVDPGQGGDDQFVFKGLDTAPVITSSMAGREFLLRADRLGNTKRGTPVYYKGIQVGKILGHILAGDHQSVEVFAFIEEPYDRLVQKGSQFWDAGGVNVTLSTSGIEVGADSVQALLSGAIEFETPPALVNTPIANEGTEFRLHLDYNDMQEAQYTERLTHILYFDGSVSGLAVGASVEFKGMKIGSVREINLEIDLETGDYFLPVLIDIEPQRVRILVQESGVYTGQKVEQVGSQMLQMLLDRGLQARLKSSNFLTGQLSVDLDLYPEKPARYLATNQEFQEIPTLPTELEEITTSLTRLVEKIETLPIDQISSAFLNTAEGLEKIVGSGELEGAIREYRDVASSVKTMVDNLDRETLPVIGTAFKDTHTTLKKVDETLRTATNLFKSADTILADGSPIKYDLSIMMRELAAASRAVRNLAEFLERNPSSLISGKK